MKTQEEIKAQAQKLKEMGSPMSLEAIVKMLTKKNDKKNKASNKAWARRDAAKVASLAPSIYGDLTIAEINRKNAMANLPSSMR